MFGSAGWLRRKGRVARVNKVGIRIEPRGWVVYRDRLRIRCLVSRSLDRRPLRVWLQLGDRVVELQRSLETTRSREFGFETVLATGYGPAWIRLIVEWSNGDRQTVGRIFGFRWGKRRPIPPRRDYYDFLHRVDPDATELRELKKEVLADSYQPLVSIVLPTYNTDPVWLDKAIDSVRAQVYPHWEICIADDASTRESTRVALGEWEKRDPRIRVTYRSENGHIAVASNSALAKARGEWVGLLDHDDELAPHALAFMIRTVQREPGLRFLYSDEDKMDEEGHRSAPYLKPDWNPVLLQSQNYICHFAFIRHDDLRAVEGFRAGTEGCQDWDLFLRLGNYLPAHTIRHVPGILYHWRMVAGSTASRIGEKDYVVKQARRILEEKSRANGRRGVWEEVAGMYWVHHPEPFENFEVLRCQMENAVKPGMQWSDVVVVIPDAATLAHEQAARIAGWAKLDLHGMVAGSLQGSGGRIREAGLLLHPDGSLVPLFRNIDRDFEGMGRRELLPQNLVVPGRWFFAVRRELWEKYFPTVQEGKTWTARVCEFALALRSAGLENVLVPGLGLEAEVPIETMEERECGRVLSRWRDICERDPGGHPFCTTAHGYLSLA